MYYVANLSLFMYFCTYIGLYIFLYVKVVELVLFIIRGTLFKHIYGLRTWDSGLIGKNFPNNKQKKRYH